MPEHRLLSCGTTHLGVTAFACSDCDWTYTITSQMLSFMVTVRQVFRTAHAPAPVRELECMIAAGWLTQEEVDAQRCVR